MKLYYTPGASSLASHIALRESGLDFEMEKVDLREKKTASGEDFYQISIKGAVPVLRLDNGEILTEGAAILQYVADLVPEKNLAPVAGSLQRYRLMEWLNMIATELHKNFIPFFSPNMLDPCKEVFSNNLIRYFDVTERQLSQTPYLLGEAFSVADAYLFTVVGYCRFVGLDLAKWPSLKAFSERVQARPAVQAALKYEEV